MGRLRESSSPHLKLGIAGTVTRRRQRSDLGSIADAARIDSYIIDTTSVGRALWNSTDFTQTPEWKVLGAPHANLVAWLARMEARPEGHHVGAGF